MGDACQDQQPAGESGVLAVKDASERTRERTHGEDHPERPRLEPPGEAIREDEEVLVGVRDPERSGGDEAEREHDACAIPRQQNCPGQKHGEEDGEAAATGGTGPCGT